MKATRRREDAAPRDEGEKRRAKGEGRRGENLTQPFPRWVEGVRTGEEDDGEVLLRCRGGALAPLGSENFQGAD